MVAQKKAIYSLFVGTMIRILIMVLNRRLALFGDPPICRFTTMTVRPFAESRSCLLYRVVPGPIPLR